MASLNISLNFLTEKNKIIINKIASIKMLLINNSNIKVINNISNENFVLLEKILLSIYFEDNLEII